MRLAEMTKTEDVEMFGKTQKITRPSPDVINHDSPQAEKPKVNAAATIIRTIPLHATKNKRVNAPIHANNGKFLLLMILLLVILGLVYVL